MENEEILEKLHKDHPIEDMMKFSELDIQDKLKENQFQVVRFKDFYHREIGRLEHLTDLMDKLVGMRYEYYRFEDNNEWKKAEIEQYCIPKDRKIMKMKKIIRRQQVKVRFFEMCWKAFEKQNWSMKLFLDTLKQGY